MPTMHPSVIQIAGLRKSFKDNHVLRGIDLDIPSGIVFALLGANGAGKTTAINVLLTGEENLRMMARLATSTPSAPRPAPPSCSSSSTSPRWRGSRPPRTPAAWVAAWTWPCR
jgi:hypothetical protein